MKDKEAGFIKGFVVVVVSVFVLMCAASLVLCAIQICRNEKWDFNGIEVSVFLTFITLAFTISIAAPYFITKNKVEVVVRNFFTRDLGPDIINKSEEITKLDAHLSRMIAFNLLQQQYYYWAVGWAFRSLKRYMEMNESYSSLYREFHEFVFKRIIIAALTSARNDKESMVAVAKNVGEDEAFRIKIRAIKDYVDFLYLIDEHSSNPAVKKMKDGFQEELKTIESEMNFLIRDCYSGWFKGEKQYHDAKRIDEFFFSASRYKDDKRKIKKFFYKNIWEKLGAESFPELEGKKEFKRYCDEIERKYLRHDN